MRVTWTYRARVRLQQILIYITEDQPDNAERFVDRLIERGDSVGKHPERGRTVPEMPSGPVMLR